MQFVRSKIIDTTFDLWWSYLDPNSTASKIISTISIYDREHNTNYFQRLSNLVETKFGSSQKLKNESDLIYWIKTKVPKMGEFKEVFKH